ncbi:MAG: hypothetical protein Ct9H300mP25_07320 [Acidobacteriota bacterium]|nr:MAG: hypothetical protein Ct9H300mP25_07320 [Acidobacteriota bacterium]
MASLLRMMRRVRCSIHPGAPGKQVVDDVPDKSRSSEIPVGGDSEIRLTYRELAALIEDAVNPLR